LHVRWSAAQQPPMTFGVFRVVRQPPRELHDPELRAQLRFGELVLADEGISI